MQSLGLNQNTHTLVFDRGNNSKKNLDIVKSLGFYYVGALTPYHHSEIIERAMEDMPEVVEMDNESLAALSVSYFRYSCNYHQSGNGPS